MLQRPVSELGRSRGDLGRPSSVAVGLGLGLGLCLAAASIAYADAAPPRQDNAPVVVGDEGAAPVEAVEAVEAAETPEMIGAPSAELIQPPAFAGEPVPEVVGVQVDLEAAALPEELPTSTPERSASMGTASAQVAVLGLALLGLGLVAGLLVLWRRR